MEIRNKSIYIDEHGNGISFPVNYGNNDMASSSTLTDILNRRYGIAKYIQINGNDDDDANAVGGGVGGLLAIELILVLPEAQKVSSGRFACIALNAIGTDEKHTHVNMLGELIAQIYTYTQHYGFHFNFNESREKKNPLTNPTN